MRGEGIFGTHSDRPTHRGETCAAGVARNSHTSQEEGIIDDHVYIAVSPGQAALGVNQAPAERTEGPADAARRSAERIGMCTAIEGCEVARECKTSVGAVEFGKARIKADGLADRSEEIGLAVNLQRIFPLLRLHR